MPQSKQPSFDEYIASDSLELIDFKEQLTIIFDKLGFVKTLMIIDNYFEKEEGENLYDLICAHTKILYAITKGKLNTTEEEEEKKKELESNFSRIEQILKFMFRADIDCKPFNGKDSTILKIEKGKFKQVLSDTIQHYQSLNNFIDLGLLIGILRSIFEQKGYFVITFDEPSRAVESAMGLVDPFVELLSECGVDHEMFLNFN